MIKESWGGKNLFELYFHSTVDDQSKSGQELKTGQEPAGRN